MHWCADEQIALMAFIGSIPFVGTWVKARLAKWRKPHCCDEQHKEK